MKTGKPNSNQVLQLRHRRRWGRAEFFELLDGFVDGACLSRVSHVLFRGFLWFTLNLKERFIFVCLTRLMPNFPFHCCRLHFWAYIHYSRKTLPYLKLLGGWVGGVASGLYHYYYDYEYYTQFKCARLDLYSWMTEEIPFRVKLDGFGKKNENPIKDVVCLFLRLLY